MTATRRPRSRRGEGERLREEILEAAERLLMETADESAVSIRAIADAVGCTAPSIYRHFADKTALIFAVCERFFERFDRVISEATAGIDDPVEAIRVSGRAYVRFGLDNPEHYRIMFMTKPDDTPESFESKDLEKAVCFWRLVDAVRQAIDTGRFGPGDPFFVATGLWATMHGLTSLLLSRPTFPWPDLDSLVDHLVGVHLRGLAPDPGLT